MNAIDPQLLYFLFFGLLGIALCALIAAAASLKMLLTRNPRLQDEFVSKSEYDRQQADIKAELARHTSSRKGIYEKLEGQGSSIARIEANLSANKASMEDLKESLEATTLGLKETNSRIEKLDERLDAIPERVIRSLKEAKGLI